jgi:hypothetical protein
MTFLIKYKYNFDFVAIAFMGAESYTPILQYRVWKYGQINDNGL